MNRLSIALCTFNGARYLPEQLQSFAEQGRPPDELVVCDDVSTDGTPELLERFRQAAPFPVHIHRNATNLGSSKNFEQAIGHCTGDVIALADQDDAWLPHKLAKIEAAFAADANLGLTFSDGVLIDESSRTTGERLWPNLPFPPREQQRFDRGEGARLLLRFNLVTGAACAFRADLRGYVLPIAPGWVHDAWIGVLAAAFARARTEPEPLVLYRAHGEQQIGVRPWTLTVQWRAALGMDAAYFDKRVACFEALADRLRTFRAELPDPTLLDAVHAKVIHSRVQADLRRRSRLVRPLVALRELLAGRYHRFGRGIKSFAVDAFL
jgi:glycosyltransferase involved in cell wall biosynthesis